MKCLNISIFTVNPGAARNNPALQASLQLLRMLGIRGHRFTFYYPDLFGRRMIWESSENDRIRTVHYPSSGYAGLFECLEEAAEGEILIKTSGAGPFDDLLDQALLEVRRPGGAIAVPLDLDPQGTLDRLRHDRLDPLHRLLPDYDLILTAGGGPAITAAYLALGARQCVPLWSLLHPTSGRIVPPPEQPVARFAALPISMGHLEALEFSFFQALAHSGERQPQEHPIAIAV